MIRVLPLGAVVLITLALHSCSPESSIPHASDPAGTPTRANQAEELVAAAQNIVGFLRGVVDFDRITVADTVVLLLTPEGGGDGSKIPRDLLRNRANWSVHAAGTGTTYPFAPPPGMTRLTTRAGRHFNCVEYKLSTRYPEFAALPHVGTRLELPEPAGCLQTWNLTFIFDSHEPEPTLLTVVYDQWEW